MRGRLQLEGQRFGDFVVLDFAYVKNNWTYWYCRCNKCGDEKIYAGPWLTYKKEVKCKACKARTSKDLYHKYDDLSRIKGVDYKEALPRAEWPRAEAFLRTMAFLKKHAKAKGNRISLETIRAAVDKLLLDGRALS